jgi:dihydroorotase
MTTQYDVVLRGGRVIDPAQQLDGLFDVAVKDGRIAAVAPDIAADAAAETIDVKGKLVIPGMIDTHAHVFRYMCGSLGLDADWVGVQSGVTTLVEQGGVSAATLPGYNEYVVKAKANRVFAFLAPYAAGAVGGFMYPDQFTPNTIDVDLTLRAFENFPQVARGMKFWAEQDSLLRYGTASIEKVATIARSVGVPIYVHLGELLRVSDDVKQRFPAPKVLETILPFLQPGDIFAHPYTDQAGGYFEADGKVRPEIREAMQAGFHFDLGYGAATTFRLVRAGIEQGFVPDTLGADIHAANTEVPDPTINPTRRGRYGGMPSMINGINLLLHFGLPLSEVIAKATCNPARIFLRPEDDLGTLRPGVVADVSVLNDERGRWVMKDTSGEQLALERSLQPAFCLRAGKRFDADSPLLAVPQAA